MRTLRDLHHSIPLDPWNPTHPVPMLSDRWLKSYPYLCTLVAQASTFKLLATQCNRHADTSRPILFDSPRRADSNETLPHSGGHLPAEVSTFSSPLTTIAMWTLRGLYHSIPLAVGNQTHSVQTLSDHGFKAFPYFCPFVLRVSTFKLLGTECYRFLD